MSTSTQKYHHGDLHDALIHEGMALVAEKGIEGLTLRELARRLGVSATAPYRHYPDKETLLAAIAADGFRQLTLQLEMAERSAAPPRSPLLQEGIAYVRFAIDQPALFRLMFSVKMPEGQNPDLDSARTRAFDALMRRIPTTAASNERTAKARGCWSLVHGLALLLLDGLLHIPQEIEPDAWLAQVIGSTVARS